MAKKRKETAAMPAPASSSRASVILHAIAAVIALLGLADATYLTVMHLTGQDVLCGTPGGCSAVLGSAYASVGRIPTAAFGIAGYFAAFSLAILVAFGYGRARFYLAVVVSGMFLATLWFLYLQAFVLRSYCPFCLLSAALVFLLAGLLLAAPSSR